VDQILSLMLPGFTKGPRRVDGRLAGPLDDRAKARAGYGRVAADGTGDPSKLPMRWSVFVARFAQWVTWYNTEHVHSRLGCTPAQAWAADPTPLRLIEEQHLRHLLLAIDGRTIGADGIRFNNLTYVDPSGALRERGGQKVQIRYMPHDDRFIHVYLDGRYLTTCYPDNALSDEQADQFYAAARAAERAASAERRAATRRGRRRLAALSSADEPVAESRLISTAEAARVPVPVGATRRRVSVSLLGIGPAVPLPEPTGSDDGLQGPPW
jgi:putative transposase